MSVTARHPQYQAHQDQWLSLRSAYQGDAAVEGDPLQPAPKPPDAYPYPFPAPALGDETGRAVSGLC